MARDLRDLAAHFSALASGGFRNNMRPVIDLLGNAVRCEAEQEIGVYQGAVGPFPATAQLADATLALKIRRGHGLNRDPDTPLYASGAYHDSIQVVPNYYELNSEVGTNVPYVCYLELGTSRMPPRPIFGPATLRAVPPCMPAIRAAAAQAIGTGAGNRIGVEGITSVGNRNTGNIFP